MTSTNSSKHDGVVMRLFYQMSNIIVYIGGYYNVALNYVVIIKIVFS